MMLRSSTTTQYILDRGDAGVSYEVWPDDKGITVRTYDEHGLESADMDLFWEEVPDLIAVLAAAVGGRTC